MAPGVDRAVRVDPVEGVVADPAAEEGHGFAPGPNLSGQLEDEDRGRERHPRPPGRFQGVALGPDVNLGQFVGRFHVLAGQPMLEAILVLALVPLLGEAGFLGAALVLVLDLLPDGGEVIGVGHDQRGNLDRKEADVPVVAVGDGQGLGEEFSASAGVTGFGRAPDQGIEVVPELMGIVVVVLRRLTVERENRKVAAKRAAHSGKMSGGRQRIGSGVQQSRDRGVVRAEDEAADDRAVGIDRGTVEPQVPIFGFGRGPGLVCPQMRDFMVRERRHARSPSGLLGPVQG